jgi:hypothetical protein
MNASIASRSGVLVEQQASINKSADEAIFIGA